MKKAVITYLLDFASISVVFILISLIKVGEYLYLYDQYKIPFVVFIFIWITVSLLFSKLKLRGDITETYIRIIKVNLMILMIFTMILFFFDFNYSRFFLLTTVSGVTLLEFIGGYLHSINIRTIDSHPNSLMENVVTENKSQENKENISSSLRALIIEKIGELTFSFIDQYLRSNYSNSLFISTSVRFNILNQPNKSYYSIVNLKKINHVRRVNKFFEAVNEKLDYDGTFICFVETNTVRKHNIQKKYPSGVNMLIYYIDVFWRRIAPKFLLTKKLYFFLTGGYNRVFSKAEILGRLISCGFEIEKYEEINSKLFIISRKTNKPNLDLSPSYGPVFKMRRVGKSGEIIYVYKFRTMHPFSEYLQSHLVKHNGYDDCGKIKNDFRTSSYGKFLRKYWIDELPQLLNVLKGEMSIVGVRPLSQVRFDEFPEDFKNERNKYKPGCLPPYVALLMQNEKDNIIAEKIYLAEKAKNPNYTDLKYFYLSVYNILTNKIRSA